MSSNSKRKLPEEYSVNKSKKIVNQILYNKNSFTDILIAYNYLRSLFDCEMFEDRVPVIVWRHQLYALFTNRTQVDIQLNKWCESGFIRFFRLGSTLNNNDVAIVLMTDFQNFVDKHCVKNIITERFMKKVIYEKTKPTYTTNELKDEYKFNDQNLSELVRTGLLARDRIVGIFLLSIPNAGEFVRSFDVGKRALISIIRKSKYKQISKTDLLRRKLPNDAKLSLEFHVYDLIGSDLIESFETSNDTILRM